MHNHASHTAFSSTTSTTPEAPEAASKHHLVGCPQNHVTWASSALLKSCYWYLVFPILKLIAESSGIFLEKNLASGENYLVWGQF